MFSDYSPLYSDKTLEPVNNRRPAMNKLLIEGEPQ